MWLADGWKDYQVIDCSKGEKLERWGEYLLVRPDPQVIWDTPKNHVGWRHKNGHYHRSAKGGGEWEFFDLPQQWSISYKNLTFNLKPFSFKHTGLFRNRLSTGTGSETKSDRQDAGKGSEPVCLYWRSHAGCSCCRRLCNPCRCLQRHGWMSQGKSAGCLRVSPIAPYPLAG